MIATVVTVVSIGTKVVRTIESAFPYLTTMSMIIFVAGIAIYVYETYWKRRMLERDLDRFDELTRIVLTRYLESKETIDAETVKYAIELINQITHTDREVLTANLSTKGSP